MSYVEMKAANVKDGGVKTFAFEYSESLAAAGDTETILVPDDIQGLSVTAQAAGGATAKIYTTTDPIGIVKSGVGITWIEWSSGAVTDATAAVFHPVTAIKMTQTGAGTSKITVRGQ